MANTNVTIRMDDEIKKKADELFADLGLSLTAAINTFVRQSIREQRIPFEISRDMPNTETIAAIEEVEKMKANPNKKTYSSFSELLEEVENEI